MRFLKIFLLSFILAACAADKDRTINPQTVKAQGGVDVGNMSSSEIPGTRAIMTLSAGWSGKLDGQTLVLKDEASSTIKAKKTSLPDLTSPDQSSLQIYFKDKTGRDYEKIEMNGLKGVRTNTIDTPELRKSDIYLITELNDLIQITSELSKANDGMLEGEKIISTVRLKYKGVAINNAILKSVTFKDDRYDYSFFGDCAGGESCAGLKFYQDGDDSKLKLIRYSNDDKFGDARVTKLGTEKEIPFDSIYTEGEFLVAPLTKIPISDIYTAFDSKTADQPNMLKPELGAVYLIRTINWPSEDLIVKVKVDSLDPLQITYKKLIMVSSEELKKMIETVNRNTIENEMPIEEGEILLYNYQPWNNLSISSFNFQYSTSANKFITKHSWDITFNTLCEKFALNVGDPKRLGTFDESFAGSIYEIDDKDFATYSPQNFKNVGYSLTVDDCGTPIDLNKSYAIQYHTSNGDNSRSVFAVVKVIDMAKVHGEWVRLKFRRIYAGKPVHYQSWVSNDVPEPLSLEFKADEKSYVADNIIFSGDTLTIENNPYGIERGLIKIDKEANQISLEDIENKTDKFSPNLKISQGDVIGVYSETLNEKAILILKIDEFTKGKTLKVSRRHLLLSGLAEH